MRTYTDAGCSSDEHRENVDAEISIPESLVGFYVEHIVCNYTTESIFHMNAMGGIHEIPNTPVRDIAAQRYVEIIHRRVAGSRIRSRNGRIDGKAWKTYIKIDFDKLLDGPIFIPEMSVVLSTSRHRGTMLNPASQAYREGLIRDMYTQIGEEAVRNPVSLVANDPSGTYRYLYTIINHEIVGVRVKHLVGQGETDNIVLIRRDHMCQQGSNDVRLRKTTFADLKRMPEMTWVIDGYRISPHREFLEDWVKQAKPAADPNLIPIDEHTRLMAEKDEKYTEQTKLHKEQDRIRNEQEAALKRENSTLKMQLEQATESRYSDQAAKLRQAELKLQQEKLEYEQRASERKRLDEEDKRRHEEVQMQHEKAMAKHKHWEAIISQVGNGLKAIGVALTAAFGIWKIVSAVKQA